MGGVASVGGGSCKQEMASGSCKEVGKQKAGRWALLLGYERLPRGSRPHWRQVGQVRCHQH